MRCRYCDSKNTRVICTEHYPKFTKRYCRCFDCNSKYRTIEQYENQKPGPAKNIKRPGVIVRGQDHPSAVFKDDDIRMIRLLREQGHTLQAIAAKYGISSSYTSRIVNRKSWSHVQ